MPDVWVWPPADALACTAGVDNPKRNFATAHFWVANLWRPASLGLSAPKSPQRWAHRGAGNAESNSCARLQFPTETMPDKRYQQAAGYADQCMHKPELKRAHTLVEAADPADEIVRNE
jgi:hypothetical protein